MENKFKEGDIVYERIHPTQKLVISRYVNGIYYCNLPEGRARKAFVYFERELKSDTTLVSNSNSY